ncbi:MAG TPA: 50S ribosomal protein L3 [archaeon]|nr:50S ribosomal protein L3 [archaeon]
MSKHKPRSGSISFYPRVRARKETPSFATFADSLEKDAKPLNFLGYKAGMIHLLAKNEAKKSASFGQKIVVPATVIECPPITVYGVRAYKKTVDGMKSLTDVLTEKHSKFLERKINNFMTPSDKKKESRPEAAEEEVRKPKTFDDLNNLKAEIAQIKLLVHTNPSKTGIGKKKPEINELTLSGSIDQQLGFAKEKLGKEISLTEVFKEKQFLDVKAVNKGKGYEGVIKRFNVSIQRRKAKYQRKVGSISPWHPPTIMWTVPRPGQMGYHNRTEYNKRVLKISNDFNEVNPLGGFKNYGLIKNDYLVLAGSVPGPAKRCIALRQPMRNSQEKRFNVSDIEFLESSSKKIEEGQ